jgi:hypothetical protein
MMAPRSAEEGSYSALSVATAYRKIAEVHCRIKWAKVLAPASFDLLEDFENVRSRYRRDRKRADSWKTSVFKTWVS